jgi:hypothetical protein
MSRRILSAVCWLPLCALSAAQGVQVRAQALLHHARELSDIRSSGAPAFRMRATFSFVGDDLARVEGTYTETWMSDSQWRREILIGNMRYLDVGGPDKHWLLFPDAFPPQADRLPLVMAYLPPDDLELTFASVSEHVSGDVSADCAVSQPLSGDTRFAFCFEKKSGALLEKTSPEKRPRNLVNFSCEYGKFLKFGDYRFPREAVCFEDRHSSISANVVELSLEPPMDPALFDPPTGSIELGRCSGNATPPTITGSSMAFPAPNMDRVSWVRVWFVVDPKGKPQNLRVLRTVAKGSNESASNILHSLHFKSATCDGKPIPMAMTLELPFTPK